MTFTRHLVGTALIILSSSALPGTAEESSAALGLTAEWIEVDLDILPSLLAKHGGNFDGKPLFEEITALLEAGKAERREVVYGRADFSTRMKIESIDELTYPTEYDPPEIPNVVTIQNATSDLVPRTAATPTAFETRNVGVTVEADPVLTETGLIHLQISAEEVEFHGRDYQVDPKSPDAETVRGVWMPKFYTMKVTTSIHVKVDGTALVGTFKPSAPEKAGRRFLLFVHAKMIREQAVQ